jgi:hypothetical protein
MIADLVKQFFGFGISTQKSVKHNSNIVLNTLLGMAAYFGP